MYDRYDDVPERRASHKLQAHLEKFAQVSVNVR